MVAGGTGYQTSEKVKLHDAERELQSRAKSRKNAKLKIEVEKVEAGEEKGAG